LRFNWTKHGLSRLKNLDRSPLKALATPFYFLSFLPLPNDWFWLESSADTKVGIGPNRNGFDQFQAINWRKADRSWRCLSEIMD
jgi:hypothetical protein